MYPTKRNCLILNTAHALFLSTFRKPSHFLMLSLPSVSQPLPRSHSACSPGTWCWIWLADHLYWNATQATQILCLTSSSPQVRSSDKHIIIGITVLHLYCTYGLSVLATPSCPCHMFTVDEAVPLTVVGATIITNVVKVAPLSTILQALLLLSSVNYAMGLAISLVTFYNPSFLFVCAIIWFELTSHCFFWSPGCTTTDHALSVVSAWW